MLNRCNGQGGPYEPLGLYDFSCVNMGISSGCSDKYGSELDCRSGSTSPMSLMGPTTLLAHGDLFSSE